MLLIYVLRARLSRYPTGFGREALLICRGTWQLEERPKCEVHSPEGEKQARPLARDSGCVVRLCVAAFSGRGVCSEPSRGTAQTLDARVTGTVVSALLHLCTSLRWL